MPRRRLRLVQGELVKQLQDGMRHIRVGGPDGKRTQEELRVLWVQPLVHHCVRLAAAGRLRESSQVTAQSNHSSTALRRVTQRHVGHGRELAQRVVDR